MTSADLVAHTEIMVELGTVLILLIMFGFGSIVGSFR